jgi:hypothetical protein
MTITIGIEKAKLANTKPNSGKRRRTVGEIEGVGVSAVSDTRKGFSEITVKHTSLNKVKWTYVWAAADRVAVLFFLLGLTVVECGLQALLVYMTAVEGSLIANSRSELSDKQRMQTDQWNGRETQIGATNLEETKTETRTGKRGWDENTKALGLKKQRKRREKSQELLLPPAQESMEEMSDSKQRKRLSREVSRPGHKQSSSSSNNIRTSVTSGQPITTEGLTSLHTSTPSETPTSEEASSFSTSPVTSPIQILRTETMSEPIGGNMQQHGTGHPQFFVTPTMQLPLPGSEGAPYFKGPNISEFLESYSDMCADAHVPDEVRKTRFTRYVSPVYREEIKGLPEYYENAQGTTGGYSEGKFYAQLKDTYSSEDWEALKFSYEFLQALTDKSRNGELTTKHFVTMFHRVSTRLIKDGKLDAVARCRLLMQGLRTTTRNMVLKKTNFDPKTSSTWDYDELRKVIETAYLFEEKARFYDEALDPDWTQLRRDHIGKVVKDLIPQPEAVYHYSLPIPPAARSEQPTAREGKHIAFEAPEELPRGKTVTTILKRPTTTTIKESREVADLAEQLTKLSLSAVSHDDLKTFEKSITGAIADQLRTALAAGAAQVRGQQLQPQQAQQAQVAAPPANMPVQHQYQPPAQGGYRPMYPPVQGNQLNLADNYDPIEVPRHLDVNAAYGGSRGGYGGYQQNQGPRQCYGCFGRDAEGNPDSNLNHTHSSNCGLMEDLRNRGCVHKSAEGQWCLGPWVNGQPGIPIFFRGSTRWFDQVRAHVRGGPFDYDLSARSGNMANRVADQQVAEAARNGQGGELEIMRRDQVGGQPINLQGGLGSIKLGDGAALESYFEEFHPSTLSVNVAGAGTRVKSNLPADAKERLRQRRQFEDQLPQAKTQRHGAIGVQRSTEIPEDMDVDVTQDEEGPETQRTLRATSDAEDEEGPTRVRRLKSTVPLPKPTKNTKMLIEALKTPNPAVTIGNQWLKDNQPYLIIMEMARNLTGHMLEGLRMPAPALQSMHSMLNSLGNEASGIPRERRPVLLQGNAVRYQDLLEKRHIVVSPRIRVKLTGPQGHDKVEGMIDTGAECNILPTHMARAIGAAIKPVAGFQLSTATGDEFGFAGMATLQLEIAPGVGCEVAFFLINKAPKILLGQPFIAKTKMSLLHLSDGSWDATFTDEKNPHSKCTVMVLPALKRLQDSRAYEQPQVEEVFSDDEEPKN